MDTGTHLVMGFALGGLATLDPVIAQDSVNTHSVLVATVIGSQIPDIDTALKFRSNAVYIRNHRGITHSIPAVILWPLLVSLLVHFLFPSANMFHLWLWSFIAVFLHVFVDIFNAYGTQAIRPLSMKWVALGMINTFDPYIFCIHVGGLILWGFGAHPGYTFLIMYIIIVFYYLLRFQEQWSVRKAVKKKIPDAEKIIIASTIRFFRWRVVVETNTNFYVGIADKRQIRILDTYKKIPVPKTPEIEAAKKDKNLSAFLSFSPIFRWEVKEKNDHSFEVRFIDLRYRSKGHYPFVAIVQLDEDLNIMGSYTGWIYNKEKLRKKLDVAPR
ncbi:metal-dependent hydrolase [Bacillus sp. FJAT-49736]|uniref:metal-dependent hydrolase n=1 Tax=Bacillus sp. FJAT-49736 TaxID=2833582 RepID=UPI001BC96A7A|nr:metal-dependent hydrolase [Bacillus sp. FJAT-49736]MBS4175163.1 metal-dependent hydrolase [Bacillus sp. FJAT-49736]